ncbi:ABC transporter six-transmembrane domain-containing protein [Salinarimonas soli]|nr:ABC transporter six-transmembrane domain-containing protein [Salinarimonas soli]
MSRPIAKPKPRGPSALEAIRPFQTRIGLTYFLTFVEDLLELSYPWATGLAIDGLLAHNYWQAAPIIVAWMLRSMFGCFRQMYDTRLYTSVYNAIVTDTILRQRARGVPATTVSARSAMSREFVTFFEKEVPVIFTSVVGIVGSALILFYYDLIIGAVTALLFVPVYLINRVYSRRSLKLNTGLNDQLEREVDIIETADPEAIRQHFIGVQTCRVKLSDAEAFNWTTVEVLSIAVFIAVLVRATYLPSTETGDIFAILVYVWRLMENLDNVPTIVQQIARLVDIRTRIEGGASIEAIGAEIERGQEEDEEEARRI